VDGVRQRAKGLTLQEMSDQERLVVGIMASLVSALGMVVEGREHHRFCYAAGSMIPSYKADWPLFYHERWGSFDDQQKATFKSWYEHISSTASIAESEIASGYRQANQRSLVFLADVLENLTESFLQICISYFESNAIAIKNLTRRRPRDMHSAVDIRKSVREWERSLSEKSRSRRFQEMTREYFPSFNLDSETLDNLDRLMLIRNKLVHELIHIPAEGETLQAMHEPTLEELDQFHNDVATYIQRLMDEIREMAGLSKPELG
jgi:hypothetical protein